MLIRKTLERFFTPFPSVSIVDFEKVNVSRKWSPSEALEIF